jgi:hypothetical protein
MIRLELRRTRNVVGLSPLFSGVGFGRLPALKLTATQAGEGLEKLLLLSLC